MPCGQTHSQSPSTPTHSIQRRSATHRKTARNHRQPSKTTKQTCLHAILPRLSCSLSPNHPRFGQLLPFFHFARQPFSLPLLLRIPPHRNRIRNRAHTKHLGLPLVRRIASHRKPAQKGRPATTPRPLTLYGSFVNATRPFCASQPRLHCANPGPSQLETAQPRHARRPSVSTRPGSSLILSATLLGLSFTSPCLCYSLVRPSALLDRYALYIILGPRGKISFSTL